MVPYSTKPQNITTSLQKKPVSLSLGRGVEMDETEKCTILIQNTALLASLAHEKKFSFTSLKHSTAEITI